LSPTSPETTPDPLEASLHRVQQAVALREQSDAARIQEFLQHTAQLPAPERWRMERQLERALRRRRLRGPFALIPGTMLGGWAVAFAAMAAADPSAHGFLGWVALGFGAVSAGFIRRAVQSKRESAAQARDAVPQAQRPEADPRIARVDALCDKLLAELREGSRVVREVVQRPEETVQGLRQACHGLVDRERALREILSPEDEARLSRERETLAARVSAEKDAVVRQRLGEALAALDRQRAQRAELVTAAARLEAEHTRLTYTLEELYTQVLRVKAADASSAEVAGAGLRTGLAKLSGELDAVAESLEAVHAPSPISPLSSDMPADVPERPRERS